VILNAGARAGDKLILTKPLGTGIISTALKAKKADEAVVAGAISSMATLNRKASESMQEIGIHAGTDITGFGLLGHAGEMVENTDVGMVITSAAVPVLPGTKELAEMGLTPGGLQRNRDFRQPMVEFSTSVPDFLADILFDPQTSGGLLISVAPGKAPALLERMHQGGIAEAAVIGEVVAEPKGKIVVH
jgi:selenide,water dikinase